MKKIFTFVVALVCGITTSLGQTSGTCGENLSWSYENDTLTITGYGPMTEWDLYTYAPWGSYRSQIKHISLPDGLTSIPKGSFNKCTQIRNIVIPDGVVFMGERAFEGCTSLDSVVISNNVDSIRNYAFNNCGALRYVYFGRNLVSIDEKAFYNCSALHSITWNAKGFVIASPDMSLSLNKYLPQIDSIAFGNDVDSIPSYLCAKMSKLLYVSIPSNVSKIGNCTFQACAKLKSVDIPNSVNEIGESAFKTCVALQEVALPTSLSEIKDFTFHGCTSLASIYIPSSVLVVGASAFGSCNSLASITLSKGVTHIKKNAFSGSVTTLAVPESLRLIGSAAFAQCSLLSVTWEARDCKLDWPDGTTFSAIFPSSVSSFAFGNNVEVIPQMLCYRLSNLSAVTIPNSVKVIKKEAFGYCSSLSAISIPNSVDTLGYAAFGSCPALTSVTIGSGLKAMELYVFAGSSAISEITCQALTPPIADYSDFNLADRSIPLYVPGESISLYKQANCWKDFYNVQAISGTEVPIYYTITFNNWDGSELLKLTDVEENTIPSYTGATPVRPSDDVYYYTFSGWSPEVVAAVADATYTATYSKSPVADGIEDIQIDMLIPSKIFVDGQVYIIRGNKIYTMQGQEAK